jgi:hypothetical protein
MRKLFWKELCAGDVVSLVRIDPHMAKPGSQFSLVIGIQIKEPARAGDPAGLSGVSMTMRDNFYGEHFVVVEATEFGDRRIPWMKVLKDGEVLRICSPLGDHADWIKCSS